MKTELGLVLVVSLAACSESPLPTIVDKKQSEIIASATADHELGRRIYNFRCYFCHGYSGNAKTLASTYINPQPRDFTSTSPDTLSREKMLEVVKHGNDGTAMRGFSGILQASEITAVTDFVRKEFMLNRAVNTHYHTTENGWPDHERYSAAFPFATGKIAIDTHIDQLTAKQEAGRRLYMSACVSCHDRSKVNEAGTPWESRPLSYPRNGFTPGNVQSVDSISGASPYRLHDKVPQLPDLSAKELRGEKVFQENCAFCHAADGTGRNWIGSFLEPHPRDLTADAFMSTMTPQRLAGVIRDGLPETSMPAWRSVLTDPDIHAVIAYIARAFHSLMPDAPVIDAKPPPTK